MTEFSVTVNMLPCQNTQLQSQYKICHSLMKSVIPGSTTASWPFISQLSRLEKNKTGSIISNNQNRCRMKASSILIVFEHQKNKGSLFCGRQLLHSRERWLIKLYVHRSSVTFISSARKQGARTTKKQQNLLLGR